MDTVLKFDEGDTDVIIAPSASKSGAIVYGATTYGHDPVISKTVAPYASERTVRVVAGTAGFGFLCIQPDNAGYAFASGTASSFAIKTDATYAGSAVNRAVATAGVNEADIQLNALALPTAAQTSRNIFTLTHFSIRMKVNSASVSSRKGRMYIGWGPGVTPDQGTDAEANVFYNTFDAADLQAGDEVIYNHLPSGRSNRLTTAISYVQLGSYYNNMVQVLIEAVNPGDIFEFDVRIRGFYSGSQAPAQKPVIYSSEAWDCMHSCCSQGLPASRAYILRDRGRIFKEIYRAADEHALINTPKSLIHSAYDSIKTLWNSGGGDAFKFIAKTLM
jgi:hypothetical protein